MTIHNVNHFGAILTLVLLRPYMYTEMDNTVCGRCSVSQIIQFGRRIFSKNKNTFCRLGLEIALAIPALNDEKYKIETIQPDKGLIIKMLPN